ncbi:MAG: sigma-54 dependent transcriptional regulator [Desulfobacteraceae bacterium]|nr:sigma-54 dependent transcriptional regulator [Desulfobacteraceae bacterium]
MNPSILIVDDEPTILQSLSGILSDEGFAVTTASNGYEALKIIEVDAPDLVLLDIWMPGIDGIETLKEIKRNNHFIQVIIITGHGTIETAVSATKLGAFDFIEKPLSIDKVVLAINNALNYRRLEEENRYLRKKTIEKHSLTGKSPATQQLRKQIEKVASTDAWILITGENGTGKELVARTIHQLSPRSDKPFVDVSCAAIPEEIIESELFGHEKGAFPGATAKKLGKFELASQGTLFLDEIGDMSWKTQAKILRVLQEQKYQRVGGSRTLDLELRIIASSNKDLEREIEKGFFREELYYRLNVIPIRVEPLRNRTEDIPDLVSVFLDECAKQSRSKRKSITSQALACLLEYPWPGNVRELKNLVERMTILAEEDEIGVDSVQFVSESCPSPEEGPGGEEAIFAHQRLEDARLAFEKAFIRKRFQEEDEDFRKAAAVLGVDASYIRKRLEK